MTIRLVLADDHPVVLEGLARIFAAEPDFEVLARVSNGGDALDAVLHLAPDVLVLDIRMPGKDGLTVLRELREHSVPTQVVVLTAVDGDPVFEAVRLGARGVLMKDAASQILVRCVREVHAGGSWIERGAASNAIERLLRRETETRTIELRLTKREWEVARLVASGLSSKAVARDLAITEGTAKVHIHHVYEKLQVEGRMGLLRHIHSRGID